MKKYIFTLFALFISIILLVHVNAFADDAHGKVLILTTENNARPDTAITGAEKRLESKLKYSRSVLNTDFDFSLTSTAKGKFSLSFFNNTNDVVAIKIYDLIGNLIFTEQVSAQGNFVKEYDLSFYETDFFVVEVGSAKYNKTKSIAAIDA